MSFSTRETRRSRIDFSDSPSLTEQSHAASSDIHTIMRKYEKTGVLEHTSLKSGEYMNLPDAPDFHNAMNIIATANSLFESVPAQIRKKFGNDPEAYLTYMQDNNNYDAIKQMGLPVAHLTNPNPVVDDDLQSSETPGKLPPAEAEGEIGTAST